MLKITKNQKIRFYPVPFQVFQDLIILKRNITVKLEGGGDFRVATEKVNKKFDFQIKKGSTNKSEIIFFESFVMF